MHPADPRAAALRDHLLGQVLRGTDGIRFHLRRLIGEGGQGWVYLANYDEPDGIPIVVKVLRPDGASHDALLRFQREASVLRQLGARPNPNPNLVRFYDHGIAQIVQPNAPAKIVGLPFTVLEYVHGQTLGDVIAAQSGTGLPTVRVRRLLRQVAWALASVHAQGIIHRDLKPSNILIATEQDSEIVKVTDFGLAKLADFGTHKTTTLAGATLGYAPPEQFEQGNERVTPRTDVFSFGAILFECLVGAPAFAPRAGEPALRVIERIVTAPRPALREHPAALPPELRDNAALVAALDVQIAHATQADPEARPAGVREFWDTVEPLLRSASEASVARSVPVRSRAESTSPEPDSGDRFAFRSLGAAPNQAALSAAVISADGRQVYAVGARAVYGFFGSSWSELAMPGWVDLRFARGLCVLPDGGALLFGEGGAMLARTATGNVESWQLPDDDVQLCGAASDALGILLVGGRRSRNSGVLVDVSFGRAPKVRTVETTATLRGVTRLPNGVVIGCGDDGALVRLDVATCPVIPWSRTGHLFAISARRGGGAFAVGTGGHALQISPNLQATLEAVQTTRDLVAVSVASDGTAWAGATHRRILQRRGTTWVRIPFDLDMEETTSILALHATGDAVLAVASDGQLLEGRRRP